MKQSRQDIETTFLMRLFQKVKRCVSILQSCLLGVLWPDAVKEKIITQVYDAFDIFLWGSLTDIYDSPMMIKATPRLISEIKADERFDQAQLAKINPDNRQASSDIKEAYMSARFGKGVSSDAIATVIQKEAYIKEYLNKQNISVSTGIS